MGLFFFFPLRLEEKNLQVNITVSGREQEADLATWKGGSILGKIGLDEVCISKEEWRFGGIRSLREKLSFIWL